MDRYEVGKFICDICKREITVFVYSENRGLDELKADRKEIENFAENNHWYDFHYSCAICGKLIKPEERELLYGKYLNIQFHRDYIPENNGVERVHKKCMKELIKRIGKQ